MNARLALPIIITSLFLFGVPIASVHLYADDQDSPALGYDTTDMSSPDMAPADDGSSGSDEDNSFMDQSNNASPDDSMSTDPGTDSSYDSSSDEIGSNSDGNSNPSDNSDGDAVSQAYKDINQGWMTDADALFPAQTAKIRAPIDSSTISTPQGNSAQ